MWWNCILSEHKQQSLNRCLVSYVVNSLSTLYEWTLYWCCLFFLKPPSSRKCFHSEWLVFCVNNILLAKPSVSYFCPANLQSLIGTAVLANQIGHRSFRHFFSSQYYFFVTNISCLELALQLWKLLQYPHRRRRFSPYTEMFCYTTNRCSRGRLPKTPCGNLVSLFTPLFYDGNQTQTAPFTRLHRTLFT